ncbi:amidohydrolase [Bhargavaea cecembensis]|uniref:Amidohydrolase n=1 Tax=Bhargavaea cecembensis TaxID=394098 RepID=A0A163EDQ6_9BACL|nr:amidohydrolase [Bhargavaea cecembensis]KZE36316.1 amidohydrolase [Bhargavaea cecembensis]
MKKENINLAVSLRRELHQHPELSNEETWTKARLIEFIKAHTDLEIIDQGNWFYAAHRAGEDRRSLAFRADFDALPIDETIDLPWGSRVPGKAHKCGHDGHSATLAGFALEVDQQKPDVNVFFLFQPAEETGDGAKQCVSLIADEQIDEIYAYHNMSGFPYRAVGIREGTMFCASKGMTIHLEGLPAHASQPEDGINPAFALASIIQAIPQLTSQADYRGLVLCTVIQIDAGEKAFGISASKGLIRLTIRALHEDELDRLQKKLEQLSAEQAEKHGLRIRFEYNDEFPETANNTDIADKVRAAAKGAGLVCFDMEEAFRGSEDFGHLAKLTKAAYCIIGNGENHPHIHTAEYDFRDELIETGTDLFLAILNRETHDLSLHHTNVIMEKP